MLQMALNRHSQILIPPETQFFTLLSRSRRGQLLHWHRIQKDLCIDVPPPPHRIGPGVSAREQLCRIADAYLNVIKNQHVTHFGDKSPEHQRRLYLLNRTFPESKLILIYRDGRDVALSLTKVPWMPHDIDVGFALWLHYYRIQQRIMQKYPERVFCVKYESLVCEPEVHLRGVLEFLGLNYEAQVAEGSGNREGVPEFEFSYKGRAFEPITSQRVGNWHRELSHEQVGRLERWGSVALRALGYELVTDGEKRLPPWHFPLLYGRTFAWLVGREMAHRTDEWLGTHFHFANKRLYNPSRSNNSSGLCPEVGDETLSLPRSID
jgi:hypothetical protein